MRYKWQFDRYVKIMKIEESKTYAITYYKANENGIGCSTRSLLTDNPPNYIKEAMALLDLQNEIDDVGYKIRMDLTSDVSYKIKRK